MRIYSKRWRWAAPPPPTPIPIWWSSVMLGARFQLDSCSTGIITTRPSALLTLTVTAMRNWPGSEERKIQQRWLAVIQQPQQQQQQQLSSSLSAVMGAARSCTDPLMDSYVVVGMQPVYGPLFLNLEKTWQWHRPPTIITMIVTQRMNSSSKSSSRIATHNQVMIGLGSAQ